MRDPLAQIKLGILSSSDIAEWRDNRLQNVKAASVRREWNLMSHAFNIAIKEWQWLKVNPMTQVRRPAAPPSRDRRIFQDEINQILYATGYEYDQPPLSKIARIGAVFLFAIETAMRAGEIAGLTPADINGRTAHLPQTKNGGARTVPLSSEALRLIKQCQDNDSIFGLSSDQISSLFRKARNRTIIRDLTFHDTRHEAITRLSKKLDVLDLARIVGIRDLKILLVYYNATAEEIAKQLD